MSDFKIRLQGFACALSADKLRFFNASIWRHLKPGTPAGTSLKLCAALILLSGCGTSSPKPVVGPIIMTDVNGNAITAVSALAPSASVYLLVSVTDDSFLGADWTVVCSSSLPPGSLPAGTVDTSCGKFTPAHTISGPVPKFAQTAVGYVTQYTAPSVAPKEGTVTITTDATALPTRTSSITLSIH